MNVDLRGLAKMAVGTLLVVSMGAIAQTTDTSSSSPNPAPADASPPPSAQATQPETASDTVATPSSAQAPEATSPTPTGLEVKTNKKDGKTGAQPATTGAMANVVTGPPPANAKPWTGSFITYGHNMTALTLNRAAEPFYNPTYFHQLDLRPQWNLGKQVFLRGRLAITQEFTLSDDTTYRNEVMLSDTWLDIGLRGTKIPGLDINVAGGLRTIFPTSKTSRAETLVTGLSPGLLFIRSFNVLSGLVLLADVRVTRFFHRYTTSQFESAALDTCGDIVSLACNNFIQTGLRNAATSMGYGGGFSLNLTEKLSITSQFRMSHAWLYELSETTRPSVDGPIDLPQNEGTQMRHIWGFFFDFNYQLTPALAVSAGSWTFSPQLAPDSTYRNPFFNRFTMLHIDLGINVDALFPKS